jgi:hypothetical protein
MNRPGRGKQGEQLSALMATQGLNWNQAFRGVG